jgi:hypothetical protein
LQFDPTNTTGTDATLQAVRAVAIAEGLQIEVVKASNTDAIDAAFAALASEPKRSSSRRTNFSPAGAFRLPRWRRATGCLQVISPVRWSKPVC